MTRMLGRQALLESLLAHGVEHVFGNPGTTESPLMDALQDYPRIRYVLALQETAVVGMADGYARATGRAAFANVHVAAGLANSLSGLYNAFRGGTPLVLTAGQSDTRLFQEQPAISANLVEMARQFTKWSTEVLHAADIPLVIRRAFKVALEPPTGPVFLSLPWNVLDEAADVEIEPPSTQYRRIRPDQEALAQAAAELASAVSPAILAGDRVAQSGAMDELVRVAETIGAPVHLVNRSEPIFPTDHPLYRGVLGSFGPSGRDAIRDCDVVLAVGANLFTPFTYVPRDAIGPSTRLLHLDSSAWEIGRVYGPTVGILADPKAGLAELATEIDGRLSAAARAAAAERTARLEREREELDEAFERMAREAWDAVPISPYRLAMEVRDVLPPGAILVDESITTSGLLHRALSFREPGAFYSHRGGAIGWGFGGALGVQLARPDRKVVAVLGDGSATYSLQALWTAAHHRLPVTYVICGNHTYRILKVNLDKYLAEVGAGSRRSQYIGMDLRDPELNYARLAEGFGVMGWKAKRPEDLRQCLCDAIAHDGPSLVDVSLGQ